MIRKILHTSDWHIGRRLKEHDRTLEFAAFFNWLEGLIINENIDTLLVAGDIFDNTTPSVQAQDMYYSFLSRLANSPCRHTIIISGNHDSPAFIDAPSELLKLSDIHVIGQAKDNPADEIITLYDADGKPELIVCAVPYLRDRDVRKMTASDTPEKADNALRAGISNHYAEVFRYAQEMQNASNLPAIAMGHLFTQGGETHKDDGVRSLYVGTAIKVDSNIFPEWLTYTALGHLHSPQKAGRGNIRYSGSPLAMGFGEAGQKKAVYILELEDKNLADIREISIPVFQRLERANGTMQQIECRINELGRENVSIWLDVIHTGDDHTVGLQEKINELAKNYEFLEILSIRDESKTNAIIHNGIKTLDSFTPEQMFKEFLKARKIDEEKCNIYLPMYREILSRAEAGE